MTSLLTDALPGTALPRVVSVPQAEFSEGEDACWLASKYGLTPDPWQTDVMRAWLGVRAGRWVASRCGVSVPRQNGKNALIEIRELYGTVALAERVLHTAHEVKTARKAFLRLLEFFDNERQYPELHAMVKEIRRTNGQEAVVLLNGGSVEFVARSRSSGRGFSVDVLVADEAQDMDDDDWSALRPTISASANPQVILTGTPPKPGKTGPVFTRMRERGLSGDDDRQSWHEWSCPDDLSSVDVMVETALRNPALGVRLQESTCADERAEMTQEEYARERLGWWQPAADRALMFGGAWAALFNEEPLGSGLSFGVAAAPDGSWSCITFAWKRSDGSVQVQVDQYRPGLSWLAPRAAELRAKYGGQFTCSSSAKGLIPQADEPPQTVQAQAHVAFETAVLGGTLHHGNESELTTSVRSARWKPYGDTRMFDRKGTADISPLDAAALAVYGLTKPLVSSFYAL